MNKKITDATNIDRAAALIEAMIEHDVEILADDPADAGDRTHGPGAIAQALADAGLLAPANHVEGASHD